MEIRIKAIHFDATAKLEEFINKKAQKLARRNESVTGFDVTLKVVKPETAMNKEASIKLTVPNSEDLFASKVAAAFHSAVQVGVVVHHGVVLHPHGDIDHLRAGLPVLLRLGNALHRRRSTAGRTSTRRSCTP